MKRSRQTSHEITAKIIDITGDIGKLNITSFVNATNSLTDMQFSFEDIKTFYDKFEKCIKTRDINGQSVVRSIDVVLYQLETYVLPGFLAINNTGANIAAVFGMNNGVVISNVVTAINTTFNSTFTLLTSIRDGFSQAVDEGVDITTDNIRNYYNETLVKALTADLAEIEHQSKLLLNIVTGLDEVSDIVNDITSTIIRTKRTTSEQIQKVMREYQLTTNNVAIQMQISSSELILQVAKKYVTLLNMLTSRFYDSKQISEFRQLFSAELANITLNLNSISNSFVSGWFADLDKNITSTQEILATNVTVMITNITEFYATQAAIHGQSSVKCLAENSDGKMAVKSLIKKRLSGISKCYEQQMSRSVQMQSLVVFRMEDIVLNAKGFSDTICKCVKEDDSSTVDEVVACIQPVSGDL